MTEPVEGFTPPEGLGAISGAILAGGRSTRMGKNKAFTRLAGVRLVDRARHAVGRLASDVMLVTNQLSLYADFPERVILDNIPHRGPLCGLETALSHAHHAHLFVAAVDNPFIERPLIDFLAQYAPHYDCLLYTSPSPRDS